MLRHSLGLVAGLLAFPALYAGIAWAAAEFEEQFSADSLGDPSLLNAVAVILAVGLVCALLCGTRISPLAALLPGAGLLTAGLWPLINYASMESVLPSWLQTDTTLDPVGPVLSMSLVLGPLLFVSALAPSRWRRWPEEPEMEMGGGSVSRPPLTERVEPAVAPRPIGGLTSDDPERTTTPFQRG
ncbi:hypothetical protein J4H86_20355 [Spiractinospora alimapuensis]|uniref:hypothetical protein n=1 Tax=Spiractinospora alimapuensis TaxID=2820884 RepID=UPI001F385BD0|nr:hypothetical protein [Spiractinospora alimapuensis]QVQ51157.1 hypothetical protein J4H86_20355 [Spiractinospora alimapuensis]